jgi:hypothetical protein
MKSITYDFGAPAGGPFRRRICAANLVFENPALRHPSNGRMSQYVGHYIRSEPSIGPHPVKRLVDLFHGRCVPLDEPPWLTAPDASSEACEPASGAEWESSAVASSSRWPRPRVDRTRRHRGSTHPRPTDDIRAAPHLVRPVEHLGVAAVAHEAGGRGIAAARASNGLMTIYCPCE